MKKRGLTNFREALKALPTDLTLDFEGLDAPSADDIHRFFDAEEEAIMRARLAFYEDTKDVNRIEDCLQVEFHRIRALVDT